MKAFLFILCLVNIVSFYVMLGHLSKEFHGQGPLYYVPHMNIHPVVELGIYLNSNNMAIILGHMIMLFMTGMIKEKRLMIAMAFICSFFFLIQLIMIYVLPLLR